MIMTRNTDRTEEVICIKSKSAIHIDWGNFEVESGKVYKRLVEKEESEYFYIKYVWCYMPFPKSNFSTLIELRDDKINQLLDGR